MSQSITTRADGSLNTPDEPIIPYFPGEGIGPEIWRTAQVVWDTAIAKAYGGKRRIAWLEKPAGEKALKQSGKLLPDESIEAIRTHKVAIKGPLTTPVGGGFRSINVELRHTLDLYACVRPVSYFPPLPSPLKHPEQVDMVLFRENTEDVYAGIEWEAGSKEAARLIDFIREVSGKEVRPDSGIGVKPMSKTGTERLVRMAIQYALANKRDSVTLVHKGNIMKYTEGAFRNWGYEVAKREFGDVTITEAEVRKEHNGKAPAGKLVIKDRIADAMFQEILLHPANYSVLAMPNLNGDYMSDSLAAMVGGLGMAPGANIGDGIAVFEATHGTAPDIAGQDKANPGSLILSGAMLLDHIGWTEAGDMVRKAITNAIRANHVTSDFASQMPGATQVSCSAFGKIICDSL